MVYACVWVSLQGKGSTEMLPTVSLPPSGNKTIDEFMISDVKLSLMGMAGPTLLQVSTLCSCTKEVSCFVVGSTWQETLSPAKKLSTVTLGKWAIHPTLSTNYNII